MATSLLVKEAAKAILWSRRQLARDHHVHLDTDPMLTSNKDGPSPCTQLNPILLEEAAAPPQTLPTV